MTTALMESLARYEATEPQIHAFARYDVEPALLLDAALEATSATGALLRVPVGVKDIFDTAGVPTERGSALYAGRIAERDADVVRNLRAAGAGVAGKTPTPGAPLLPPRPARNPWDPSRTPGRASLGLAGPRGPAGRPPCGRGRPRRHSAWPMRPPSCARSCCSRRRARSRPIRAVVRI